MCLVSFTLDWNLSKSAQILGWLTLHTKTKFQSKTKTKWRKIFVTSCLECSLGKFFQVRYIINKQTRAKNVLWMNKNLKNITLSRGYTGIISLETFESQTLSRTFQKIFSKWKFSPVMFEKIPSFVCLVFKIENKWISKFQILFSWKAGWFENKLYQPVTFRIHDYL